MIYLESTWTAEPLSELGERVTGVTYKKAQSSEEFVEGYIPLLKANNIENHQILFDDFVYVPPKLVKDEKKIQRNDILIAASSGSLSVVGKAGQIKQGWDGSFGAFCKVLRPNLDKVNPKYLAYFFQTNYYRSVISHLASGANINNINNSHFDELFVPTPPLETQKKIAAILDKADALRQKRRQTIAKLDELIRSVFLDMFGDPDKNPKGWEIGKFSDLAIIERNSVSPDEFAEHNYYLGLQDIEKDTGKILDRTEGAKVDLKSNKYSFNQNHILYGKLRPYLNKVASPDFSGFCSTDILPIKPIRNISNKSFLTYLMRHQSFVKYADTKSSGANLPRISPKLVKEYPAILPPIQKQEEFSLKANRINWLKEKNSFQFEEFNHLFNSLLQKAFKGELYFSGSEEPLLAAEEAAEYSA